MLEERGGEMGVEFYSQERKELKKKVELLLQKQKDIVRILKVLVENDLPP